MLNQHIGNVVLIKCKKLQIITSSDAHCPEDVGYKIEEMSHR